MAASIAAIPSKRKIKKEAFKFSMAVRRSYVPDDKDRIAVIDIAIFIDLAEILPD